MRINDLAVELGDSLEIRGGISIAPGGATTFIAPSGTNGFFARPILIRGGLLGFDFPGPIDDVLTTAELAGAPSDIRFDLRTFAISLPLKLHLENPFLGPHCHVGSNGSPIQLNLQTTRLGTPRPGIPAGLILDDQVSADTTFTVPGASSCGIGLGLVNGVVNLRLGLPSGSGNNSLVATNDIGLIAPILVP